MIRKVKKETFRTENRKIEDVGVDVGVGIEN
jgi:hypothetical protein